MIVVPPALGGIGCFGGYRPARGYSIRSEFDKGLREQWTLPPKRAADNAKLIPV